MEGKKPPLIALSEVAHHIQQGNQKCPLPELSFGTQTLTRLYRIHVSSFGRSQTLYIGSEQIPPANHLQRFFNIYSEKSSLSVITQSWHSWQIFYCLSNRKFERLVGPLDEIVTIFVHKNNAIIPRRTRSMT